MLIGLSISALTGLYARTRSRFLDAHEIGRLGELYTRGQKKQDAARYWCALPGSGARSDIEANRRLAICALRAVQYRVE